MHKIVFIGLIVQVAAAEIGKIQKMNEISKLIRALHNELDTLDVLANQETYDNFEKGEELGRIARGSYKRNSRNNAKNYSCVFIGRRCIPACRKYFGKVGRNCTPMEKQRHLITFLF